MASIFRPKHQKIILQCYPSPSLPLAETLPNAAEVSSLIYYASTRRTKLDKVGTFLTKKTVSDVAHQRLGHIIVTLHILDQLLLNCSEDVGMLSPYVLAILQNITNLMELSSHLASLDVFITYCKTVQANQSAAFGDAKILSNFWKLTNHFYFCNGEQNSNNSDWCIIPVKTARAISESIEPAVLNYLNLKSSKSTGLISDGVNILLHTIHKSSMDLSLVKLASNLNPNSNSSSDKSISDEALETLASFFNTSSKSQMDNANTAIITFALKNNIDLRWSCNLLAISTKKSHIELRYRVIGLLLLLIDGSQTLNIKIDVQASQSYLANIIAYLLSIEDIQFFAVPVNDIIAKLITLDARLVDEPETEFSQDLQDCYSEIVKNLSHRIYYNDQINDMLSQICDGYATIVNENDITQKGSFKNFSKITDIVINHINDILNISLEPSIKVKINPMSHYIFKKIYYSLEHVFDDIIEKGSTHFSTQLFINDIVSKWLELITMFNNNFSEKKWLQLNHGYSASNTNDNVICFYLDAITRVLVNAQEFGDENSCSLAFETTKSYIKSTNGNFLINWWKFSKSWLANGEILYIMSLMIMKLSGYQSVVELADEYISITDMPSWTSEQGKATNDHPQLEYTKVTETLKNVPELKDLMIKLTAGATDGSTLLSLPVLDFGKPPQLSNGEQNLNILSDANSIRSWKVVDSSMDSSMTSNGTNFIRRPLESNDNRSLSMTSALLTYRIDGYPPSRLGGSGSSIEGLVVPYPIAIGTNSSRVSLRSFNDTVRINLNELRQTTFPNGKENGSQHAVGELPQNGANQPKKSGLAFAIKNLDLETEDTL